MELKLRLGSKEWLAGAVTAQHQHQRQHQSATVATSEGVELKLIQPPPPSPCHLALQTAVRRSRQQQGGAAEPQTVWSDLLPCREASRGER